MSWLFIDSVALMCDTCEWSYIVNLQDRGAIQIGDDNIASLNKLNISSNISCFHSISFYSRTAYLLIITSLCNSG